MKYQYSDAQIREIKAARKANKNKRLDLDVRYADRITFLGDLRILIKTIHNVLCQEDVAVDTDTAEQYLDEERKGKA